MRDVVEAIEEGWRIPLEGFVCCRWERDQLILTSPDSDDDANVSGWSFEEGLGRQLVAREARVVRATASPDSTLRVDFDGGVSVVVLASSDFEAWEVEGPGLVKVIAPAGGGEPAIFDATSETRTIRPGDPLPPDLEAAFESFGLPRPTGAFELRRATGRTKSIELREATDEMEDRQ